MKKHYSELIQRDALISNQLRTPEGREHYWGSLLREAESYDLIDLLKKSIELGGDVIEFGVWRGQMTKRMLQLSKFNFKKTNICLSSFEGFGEETITEKDTSLFRSKSKLEKKFSAANDVS